MRKLLLLGLGALSLVACRSVASPDPSPDHASSAVPRAIASPAPVSSVARGEDASSPVQATAPAEPLPPLDWGTRPPADGVLFPIVDGMCIHAAIFPLDKGAALFAYGQSQGMWSRGGSVTAALVTPAGLAPQADQGFGKAVGWSPELIGGSYPDHLFALSDVSSRMVSATQLRVGSARDAEWKTLIEGGGEYMPEGPEERRGRRLSAPLLLEDGSAFFAQQEMVQPRGTVEKVSYSFRLLRADGTLAPPGAKVPGADLAEAAFGGTIARLASGEVVGVTAVGQKLIRWSPTRPVDDLPMAWVRTKEARTRLLAGRTRAFVQLGASIVVYDGERITTSKLGGLDDKTPWAVTSDDALVVLRPSGVLEREGKDGAVSEERVPMPGSLVVGKGEEWIVSAGKGPRGSDALHRRTERGWEPVPLPEPPFGNDTRSPLKVEGVIPVARGDVFVNVRRVEKGLGWSTEEPYRAIYRTKRPEQVLRCQDVRHDSTGVGLHAWPPGADASCTTPAVAVLTEPGPKPAKDYPNVRAKLKGKTEYGGSLAFVTVPGRGYLNLVIPMDDVTKAKALATYLSKSLDLRADVVCGKPSPTRTLSFDVAKGTLSEK